MTEQTTAGMPIDTEILCDYFANLVNRFFKILPMREQNEESLTEYMRSLQVELLGCRELVCSIHNDSMFLTLLSILQWLIDSPECSVKEVKREVFHVISICGKIEARYTGEGGG